MVHILSFTTQDLHKEFQINFTGENAMDAGGLFREWLTILIKKSFSEENDLFVTANTKSLSYTFPCIFDDAKTSDYIFLGKLLGKAIFENVPVYCPFTSIIFKHIIGEDFTLKDLALLDNEVIPI